MLLIRKVYLGKCRQVFEKLEYRFRKNRLYLTSTPTLIEMFIAVLIVSLFDACTYIFRLKTGHRRSLVHECFLFD